jgi:hypothetical protein
MAHPRDHILPLSYLGSAAQTDVTQVTVKVRVNGGAATTYSSVTSPAITQNADNTSLYELDIAANTYADGDRVARTWYYNSVVQTGAVEVIAPASVDGSFYTTARGTKLDQLDAAVSSRSTYAGGDTAGTTTLLSRLSATRAGYLDNLTNLDATISSIATAITAVPAAVWNALTSGLSTVGSIGKLLVTNVDTTVSSRASAASLGSASVTLVSPVLSSGVVDLISGDDYKSVDGRALTWTSTSFPDLTSGSVSLITVMAPTQATTTFQGSVTSATSCMVELTAAQSGSLATGNGRYAVRVTLADTHIVTLVNGPVRVRPEPPPSV